MKLGFLMQSQEPHLQVKVVDELRPCGLSGRAVGPGQRDAQRPTG